MLRGLRQASSNWLGKTVMATVVTVLVVSFAIWGVGDMFRISGRTPVATIGGTDITAEQFRQIFNERLQQLSRQVGRPVTPTQALSIGFDQQVLGQLLAETALDETARSMRLNVSNAEIAKRIYTDPAFRGITGEFDRGRFEQLIRQGGFTEQRFINEQRRLFLRRQLANALSSGVAAPTAASEAFARYEGETRSAEYVVLTKANAGEIAAPAPDVLEKYFEDRKITFRAPEYRKLIVLALTADEIARSIAISDDEAKRIYEERKARYSTPEKRELQQMVFPDAEAAAKAAEQIAGGSWFEVIASERGLKPTDINLGMVTKASILDPAIAEAAFALKEGGVSAPVTGRFGTVLVRVNKIEPASMKSYADVAAEIKGEVALERAKAEVSKRRDKIEDELAGGARLDEAAQKAGTPVRTIEAIDRSGRGPDGNPVADLPAGLDIAAVFSTDVGVESDPAQVNGGFIWFEVAGITPARDRKLDEVKDKVEARWREDQLGTLLKAKADAIIEQVKGGKSLADAVAGLGLKVETAKAVKRRGSDLPAPLVAAMFQTAKDTAASSDGKDAGERIVFKVTDVSAPAYNADSPETKRISDTLRNAISEELLTQYVAKVESDLGTSINRAALNQAVTTQGGGN